MGDGGKKATGPAKPARRKTPSLRNFYRCSLSHAEQVALPQAAGVEGLEEEIAVLRVRLRTALKERPEDIDLLMRGMAMLVRAVATQYRLSPRARRDLAENFAATLNSLADQLLPAGGGA